MKKLLIAIFIVCLMTTNSFAQKEVLKKLNRIKLLKSNETDVEAILGKAKKRFAFIGEYENKDGEFDIYYSRGGCPDKTSLWDYNVEKGLVAKIMFTPKKKIRFSSLGIDVSKLPVEYSTHNDPPVAIYNDDKSGKSYEVYKNLLVYVTIEPPESLWHLGCDRINK
jgi:hypothetical protein